MKLIVDILLFTLMILEFSRGYMDPIIHEIIGIILFILMVLHTILNINYFKTISKGKYNFKRFIMLIINIGFMISFVSSIILGLMSSQSLLTFMNIENIKIIKLHKISAYISLIFMSLHLGININSVTERINKKVLNIFSIFIIIFGIYSFVKLDIIKHITGEFGFSVMNENLFMNVLQYLSVVLMITVVTNKIYNVKGITK